MNTFLKELREKSNASQEHIAKTLNLSRPTYALLEQGNREMTVSEAKKLAKFFNMSLEDFLAEEILEFPEVYLETQSKKVKKKVQKTEMRISVPQESVEKFKEVLLYILENIGALPNIGEAVICKLLYFIDFDYYEKYEEQLIGATYIKNHHGPTPPAFVKIIKEMEKDGDLVQVVQKYFQYDQKKYLPRRKADLSNFTIQEKELIDWEINRFKGFNAAKMEDYSHKDVPWIGADHLQVIDYEAVFCRTPEFSVRQYDDDSL